MEILLIPHKCEKLDKGNFDSVLQIPKELNLIKHSSHKKGGNMESKVITITDNITQIKYIKVVDKLYQVTDISFADMTIRAVETTTAALVPQNEVFGLDDLKEFKIKLINNGGMADIVDFSVRKKTNAKYSMI